MANNSELDDDGCILSSHALSALNEFLKSKNEKSGDGKLFPEEDWQLSQFWYSNETKRRLVNECIAALGEIGGRIGCVSCPSLVPEFLGRQEVKNNNIRITLFEYDIRFLHSYEDLFVAYDYTAPMDVPSEWHNYFDLVIADPPFLSDECMVKTSETIRLLSKDKDTKFIICTGSKIEELVCRLLNAKVTNFKPEHANNLGNDFSSYTNYKPVTL